LRPSVHHGESHLSVNNNRLRTLKDYLLTKHAASRPEVGNLCPYFQNVPYAGPFPIVDVDVDDNESSFLGPSAGAEALFKERPSSFFKEFQIAGIVDVSIRVYMISPNFYCDDVSHSFRTEPSLFVHTASLFKFYVRRRFWVKKKLLSSTIPSRTPIYSTFLSAK